MADTEVALTAILHDGVLYEAGTNVSKIKNASADEKKVLRESGAIGSLEIPAAVVDELAAKDAEIAALKAALETAQKPVDPKATTDPK